jgi:hypothetical protein
MEGDRKHHCQVVKITKTASRTVGASKLLSSSNETRCSKCIAAYRRPLAGIRCMMLHNHHIDTAWSAWHLTATRRLHSFLPWGPTKDGSNPASQARPTAACTHACFPKQWQASRRFFVSGARIYVVAVSFDNRAWGCKLRIHWLPSPGVLRPCLNHGSTKRIQIWKTSSGL